MMSEPHDLTLSVFGEASQQYRSPDSEEVDLENTVRVAQPDEV